MKLPLLPHFMLLFFLGGIFLHFLRAHVLHDGPRGRACELDRGEPTKTVAVEPASCQSRSAW
jgi:hypothetical protein